MGTTGVRKDIDMSTDRKGHHIFTDGNDTIWVVDGKPHFMNGNPNASYTAYCDSLPLNAPNADKRGNGILVEAYEGGKPIFSVRYVVNAQSGGVALDYSVLNPDGTLQLPADTFTRMN